MTEPAEPPTCGAGLAEHAPLPAALGRLVAALADNLELHMRSLDPGNDAARAELDAYVSLARQFRALASQLHAVATEMEGYRSLPVAPHDETLLADRKAVEAFELFTRLQAEVLAHLERAVARDRAMVEQMRGAG